MDFSSVRTGIAAGSSVPRKMMADLREKMNMKEITSTYGKWCGLQFCRE